MNALACASIDSAWPPEEPEFVPDSIDGDAPLELDERYWDALIPEDDYEPAPERGDFWIADDD
jgi:hypothetical protein